MAELRPIVEHLVDDLRKLPPGEWYLDDNRPYRIMLHRPKRGGHCAVVEDDGDGGLRAYKPGEIPGDGEHRDMRAIVDVLNAARALVPADGSAR